jgi:hypothetical protein
MKKGAVKKVVGVNDVNAVALGMDQTTQVVRKSRVRKEGGSKTPRAATTKKPKIVKAPRNPFRRSDTGKLNLKRLQMNKRLDTMGPRVAALRERLSTMETRHDFVTGKLKLVCEELASREADTLKDDVDVTENVGAENKDEDIELDDEIVEDGEEEDSDVESDEETVGV